MDTVLGIRQKQIKCLTKTLLFPVTRKNNRPCYKSYALISYLLVKEAGMINGLISDLTAFLSSCCITSMWLVTELKTGLLVNKYANILLL